MNKNSKIFSILNTYLQKLAESGFGANWADDVKNMWDAATPGHRHLILDLIAHTKIYDGDTTRSWEELTTQGGYLLRLSIVMNALAANVPLTRAQGYTPDLFPTEADKTFTQEIDAHNVWRSSNPYWCGTQFVEDDSTNSDSCADDNMVSVPTISPTGWKFIEALCAVLMAPVAAAPAVISQFKRAWKPDLTRRTPNGALPGATMFWHQCNLYDYGDMVRAVALGNLPAQVVKKYSTWGLGSFTGEEYLLWAETMEELFPARELALRWVTTGEGYYVSWQYLKEQAAGHVTSIFKDMDEHPNHIPVSTQLWLLERHRSALTYDADTYTL